MQRTTNRPGPSITEARRFLGYITPRRVAEAAAEALSLAGSRFTITEKHIGMIRDTDNPVRTEIAGDMRSLYLTGPELTEFKVHYDSWSPGESVRLHIHEGNAEYLLYLGHAEATVGDRQLSTDRGTLYTFDVEPGVMVGVPKGFPHRTWNYTGDALKILSVSVPAQRDGDRTDLGWHVLEQRGWLRKRGMPPAAQNSPITA